MAKQFVLNGWNKEVHIRTAEEFYEWIVYEAVGEDINYIAPIKEIVCLCENDKFPKSYAREIRIKLLETFSCLIAEDEIILAEGDLEAIYSCYNSLKFKGESTYAKKMYLLSVIQKVAKYHMLPVGSGDKYISLQYTWIRDKYKKYCKKSKINFPVFIKELKLDFEKTINKAADNGEFAYMLDDEEAGMKVDILEYLNSFDKNLSTSELF